MLFFLLSSFFPLGDGSVCARLGDTGSLPDTEFNLSIHWFLSVCNIKVLSFIALPVLHF